MAYTSEDPYNAVQEEIENSLQAARTLCSSYVRIRGYASTEEEKEAREEVWLELDCAMYWLTSAHVVHRGE